MVLILNSLNLSTGSYDLSVSMLGEKLMPAAKLVSYSL